MQRPGHSHIKFLCFLKIVAGILHWSLDQDQNDIFVVYHNLHLLNTLLDFIVNWVLLSTGLLKYVTVENLIFIYLPAIVYLIGLFKYTLNCDL